MLKNGFGRAAMGLAISLAAVTASLGVAGAAQAGVVYESASYTGQDTGEYIITPDSLFGAAFHLDGKTNITSIGAQFGGFPSGEIFGAIVSLSSLSSFPAGSSHDLSGIALAHTTFAVTPGTVDFLTPLAVTLGAGDYALILGSGQFGATGWAGLGDLNTPVGSPSLIRSSFSNDWGVFTPDSVRMVVEGTAAAPEPESWALMIGGMGVAGCMLRGRRRMGASVA
jgi:hypothetical protein